MALVHYFGERQERFQVVLRWFRVLGMGVVGFAMMKMNLETVLLARGDLVIVGKRMHRRGMGQS